MKILLMIAFLLALSVWLAWTPDKTEQVLMQSYSRPLYQQLPEQPGLMRRQLL